MNDPIESANGTMLRDAMIAELSAWRFHDNAIETGLFRTIDEELKSLDRCRVCRADCERIEAQLRGQQP